MPSAELARHWHSTSMQGLTGNLHGKVVPAETLSGKFRGEEGLEGVEVRIGPHPGTPSAQVSEELAKFEETLTGAVEALDGIVHAGEGPSDKDELNAVIELCAWAHAEWVRIHPFANGNGRTARIWAGFIAMRYGLPPFVRLRPRPDDGYGAACGLAMRGDWAPTAEVFRRMYLDIVRPR
nr:Fic family protein [Pseudoruegeria sp. HB172150]